MAPPPSSMMKSRRRIRSPAGRCDPQPAIGRAAAYHAPAGVTIAAERPAHSSADCPNPGQPAVLSAAEAGQRPVMASAFDEMRGGGDGAIRPAYAELARWLDSMSPEGLLQRRREAELLFRRIGITFAVHGEAEAQERLIPFDVIPRILSGAEWATLARGLEQRVRALNLFLKDVYSQRANLRAGIVPEDLSSRNPVFRPEMNGQKVPHDLYVLIAGIDIVRVDAETFYVLEDNARTPSGVSYMLENREIMLRLFPALFSRHRVA